MTKSLCLWNNIAEKTEFPEAYYFQKFHAKYIFFTIRKGFSKLSLGEKFIPEILEKKLEKKLFFQLGYGVILENKKKEGEELHKLE